MANRRVWDAEEISVFCEQISLILSSNISLYEGVEALQSGYAGTGGQEALRAMDEEMKGSGSFAAAVSASGVFPAYMTGMVRVGEESGELEAVMQGLAAYYHQEAQLRAGAASAVRYPLTLMGVMALVIAVLVFQVIPIFEQAFRSLSGGIIHLIAPAFGGMQQRITGTDLSQSVIAAAAVGKQHLPVAGKCVQLGEHSADGTAFVINWDDQADFHARKSFLT